MDWSISKNTQNSTKNLQQNWTKSDTYDQMWIIKLKSK
jgi:hypothetical protein